MDLPPLTPAALTAALCPLPGGVLDEHVAIILSDGALVPVDNLARDPAHHWAVGRKAWAALHAQAKARGLRVTGHVHSHVADGPDPSALDYRSTRNGWVCAVWHLRTGRLTWYSRHGIVGRQAVRPHGAVRRILAAILCH